MKIGFKEVVITPEIPANLGGYGDRKGPGTGIHDDIHTKAWVFQSGQDTFAMVISDLIGFPRSHVEAAREKASALSGIPKDKIFIGVTHTHSAPIPMDTPTAKSNPAYTAHLIDVIAGAVFMAKEGLTEGSLGLSAGQEFKLGANRRDPRKPFDPTLTVLSWHGGDGVKGIMGSFGCHPTVMSPANLLITADYPGAMTAAVRRILARDIPVLWANGSAGDVSTRFTRRGQSWAELERFGILLGGHVAALACAPDVVLDDAAVAAASQIVELPRKQLPGREEADRRVAEYQKIHDEAVKAGATPAEVRVVKTRLEGALRERGMSGYFDSLEFRAEIAAARVGDLGIAMVPGELFSSLGKAIRDSSPFKYTMIASYMNGYVGYIPDREAYAEGGYEALSSHLSPEAADVVVSTAAKLLNSLR